MYNTSILILISLPINNGRKNMRYLVFYICYFLGQYHKNVHLSCFINVSLMTHKSIRICPLTLTLLYLRLPVYTLLITFPWYLFVCSVLFSCKPLSNMLTILPVQFIRPVMSDSLRPHGLQHARLPCPSPTPGACSNSYPSSQ